MSSALLQQFQQHWHRGSFMPKGATCLLAVSGGADSMVMAHLFRDARIPFAVAHCNYALRGEASDLDEQLVQQWCSEKNITFHHTHFDTKQKAAEWKKGIQETARILRYEYFEQVRKAHGYACIATAHHANDNVETLLINLFKGAGITGLHGILPVNGNIIRPLLFATREEITAYAHENKVPYRDDASNATDDYLRNAVRHNLVPVIKDLFPGAVRNVSDTIGRIGEAEQLYKKAIEQERKKLLEQRGHDYYIPILKLRHRKPLATILYELLQPFGFASAQVPHVQDLLTAETGRYISSSTHRIIRNRDFLVITTLPSETADLVLIEAAPCTVHTGKYSFSFSIQDKPKAIPVDTDEAYIDLATVEFPLILRPWRTGDYLYPLGMKMKMKKVKRLLIDEKVPLHEKEHVRILECAKRIVWVSGIRLDERFKLKESTEKVLVVKLKLA